MRIPSTRTAGLVLACVAAVGPVSGLPPQPLSGSAEPDVRPAEASGDRLHPFFVRKVREVLAPPDHGTVPVQEEVVAALAGLGGEAVPTLMAFLTGELDLQDPEAGGEPVPPGPLAARKDVVILDALALLPEQGVVQELRRVVAAAPDYATRMVVMRVLAHVDGEDAFDVWLEAVLGIDPILLMRGGQGGPIEEALAKILARDRSASYRLAKSSAELPPPLWPVAARAVGSVGDETGLDVLERLAGRSPEADAAVLEEVGTIAKGLYTASPERCYAWVRPMLRAGDPRTRSRAIGTLVDLGDADSIPVFIDLLEDPSRRVQTAARQALERLSGRKLGLDPKAWDEWFDGQRRWLETEAVALRHKIDSRDPAEVVQAVGALSQRRLFREEIVEVLAGALWRDEAEIVAATCMALGQLGSKRAAPYLLDALRDPEDVVRDSAWRALKLLTEENLPPEYEVWERRLRG